MLVQIVDADSNFYFKILKYKMTKKVRKGSIFNLVPQEELDKKIVKLIRWSIRVYFAVLWQNFWYFFRLPWQ